MHPRSHKLIVSAVAACGLAVLVGAGLAVTPTVLEQWYLSRLESEDDAARRVAAGKLGRLRSAQAVGPLIRILREESSKPPPLHYSAAALADIGVPALPDLIDSLEDVNSIDSDETAAEALIRIGPPAVPLLIKAYRHPSRRVRNAAAYVLANFGPTTEAPLLDLLRSGSEEAVQHVAEALEHMGAVSAGAVRALVDALGSESPGSRLRAIRALERVGGSHKAEVLPALVTSLADDSAAVRRGAARALGRLGPTSEGVQPLIGCLDDGDHRVRIAAASALGSMGPQARGAAPFLSKVLDDCSADDVFTVANALMSLGSAEVAIPALVRTTGNEDSSVREHAARMLGVIGPQAPHVMPAVIRLVEDPQWRVRRRAIQALGVMGAASKAAVQALVEALKDAHPEVRVDAVEALGKLGPEAAAAIPALKQAIADSESPVAWGAAEALKRIEGESLAPEEQE